VNLSIYPNPVRNNANIAFTLGFMSDVEITVLDINGKMVKNFLNTNMDEGDHQLSLDVSSLTSGTYLVRLEANQDAKVTKFVKY
jgi:YbbR domain-containing protein